MLKSLFRHATPPRRAQFLKLATLWACAWLVWMPAAHAAEAKPSLEATRSALATPFDQYQVWREELVSDWREVNDRVGEIGGWRTYLRESQENSSMGQGDHGHHAH